MKKRNILLGIICFVFLSILTGFGNKTAINTAQFKSIAENKGYTITDATSQYAQYGYINEATIATNNNEWQAEFYVLSDEGNATSMYNTNLEIFASYKGNSSSESSSSASNYTSYSLTSSGYYMHLCRIDNTLLYVKVSETYKDIVKDFIKELGY